MPTRDDHAVGDVFQHHERRDVVGRETRAHGNNRPIVDLAAQPVMDAGLCISLYLTHGETRTTFVPVTPKQYPGEPPLSSGYANTQELWTFPTGRLFLNASGHIKEPDQHAILKLVDALLCRPVAPWPTKARIGEHPLAGSVVWYRTITRQNDDVEAIAVHLDRAGVRGWRPKEPLPCVVLTSPQPFKGGPFPLVTLVPLLDVAGLVEPSVRFPDGSARSAITSVLFTIDPTARRGVEGMNGRFIDDCDGRRSWVTTADEYIEILNDVRKHLLLPPV